MLSLLQRLADTERQLHKDYLAVAVALDGEDGFIESVVEQFDVALGNHRRKRGVEFLVAEINLRR